MLDHKGSISHAQMEEFVESVYERFDVRRKTQDAYKADADELEELKQIAQNLKAGKPEE